MHLATQIDNRGSPTDFDRPKGERTVATLARILVVDDDLAAGSALAELLRDDGFSTVTVAHSEEALAEARGTLPDLVLADLHMPDVGGVELCTRLHAIDPELPVIVMTAFADMESAVESLRAGAEDYLVKPLDYEIVQLRVKRAIARRVQKREQVELHLLSAELQRNLNERLVISSIREQELAESEARQRSQLHALLETLSEGVVIVSRSGEVQMVNAAAREILGTPADDELRTVDALHALESYDLEGRPLPTSERPVARALRGETFVDYEILRPRPDGERRRVVSTGTSVKDARGDVSLALVVFHDVTELRRLERQRDEYLALVSHDLRNPLNTIMLLVSALRRAVDDAGLADAGELAERAQQNVRRMTTMVGELAETAAHDSEHRASVGGPCDLLALVGGVVARMDDKRAVRITIRHEGAAPHVVVGDASRLERVVANLLTNALKYSADNAPVEVLLGRSGGDIVLDVIDHGIGIEPASSKLLFERGYRTTGGQAHASGLGLGLYIARLIAEAHRGRIEVESRIGSGSRFRLILPAQPVAP